MGKPRRALLFLTLPRPEKPQRSWFGSKNLATERAISDGQQFLKRAARLRLPGTEGSSSTLSDVVADHLARTHVGQGFLDQSIAAFLFGRTFTAVDIFTDMEIPSYYKRQTRTDRPRPVS